jgi:enoyl-CoA hydratase/carnithine racemase
VNRVVDDGELSHVARDIARRLAGLPPHAVRETKRLIRHGPAELAARMDMELQLFREHLTSPEAAEAFRAFMEKRKPDFSQFA